MMKIQATHDSVTYGVVRTHRDRDSTSLSKIDASGRDDFNLTGICNQVASKAIVMANSAESPILPELSRCVSFHPELDADEHAKLFVMLGSDVVASKA